MTQNDIIEIAKKCGFDEVNPIDTQKIVSMDMVRDTCKTNKCGRFDTNWGCPPHGSKEEDEAKLRSYKNGLILQCIGKSEKRIDRKMYAETGERLSKGLRMLCDEVKKEYPNALILGAGPCMYCNECAKPNPCRFPEKRIEALEGYGVFITQLCRDNGVNYYYGEGTIAYNGAILW